MDVTRDDVMRCAHLARLSLQEAEIEPMRRAMAQMLTHAASLDELDLSQVEPMLGGLAHPPGGSAQPLPLREDLPTGSFTQAEALANAPEQDRGQFVVPKVL